MKESRTKKEILEKLLLQSQGKGRVRIALLALCAGLTLLLLSALAWWNFTVLLSGDKPGSNTTSTYIVIGKQITEQNMGATAGNSFSARETAALMTAPQVEDVGEITPALFPVYAVIGGNLAMSTDLPLESVPDRFLDDVPDNWDWQPGSRNLPLIISSQFLDIYNYVFAPGQGLPQLSRTSVKSVALKIRVGGEEGQAMYGHVSGFSDRIGSVLAPQSFIAFGNKAYAAAGASPRPSQLILKVKDPSDARFTGFLATHGYTANPQNLRWSKIRAIVEVVTSATGILALLITGISMLVFVLFVELTITRAQGSLILLRQLGYSPRYLRRFMAGHFLPMVAGTAVVSLAICLLVQVAVAAKAGEAGLILPRWPGWPVWLAFVTGAAILLTTVAMSVRKAMKA